MSFNWKQLAHVALRGAIFGAGSIPENAPITVRHTVVPILVGIMGNVINHVQNMPPSPAEIQATQATNNSSAVNQ